MGKVKPMRVTTPRIVQPGEGSRAWLWMILLVALAAWSWQVYEFGRQQAGFSVTHRDQLEESLRTRIAELEQERDALRANAARFERSGQIDRAAADDVQAEVKALQDERAELKREVAFLKSLVSGGDQKLALADHRLEDLGERTYRFEVTLSKRTDQSGTVSGQVVIALKGRLGDQEKTLDMASLTDGRRSNIGIKFKNFQKLRADMKLPDGFEPISIEVAVTPEVKGFKAFEQSYEWKLTDA